MDTTVALAPPAHLEPERQEEQRLRALEAPRRERHLTREPSSRARPSLGVWFRETDTQTPPYATRHVRARDVMLRSCESSWFGETTPDAQHITRESSPWASPRAPSGSAARPAIITSSSCHHPTSTPPRRRGGDDEERAEGRREPNDKRRSFRSAWSPRQAAALFSFLLSTARVRAAFLDTEMTTTNGADGGGPPERRRRRRDATQDKARRGEARRGEARRGEARRGDGRGER